MNEADKNLTLLGNSGDHFARLRGEHPNLFSFVFAYGCSSALTGFFFVISSVFEMEYQANISRKKELSRAAILEDLDLSSSDSGSDTEVPPRPRNRDRSYMGGPGHRWRE